MLTEEKVTVLVVALERAKGDMIWMFGAWDGSMEGEAKAVPLAHANIKAIDDALAIIS